MHEAVDSGTAPDPAPNRPGTPGGSAPESESGSRNPASGTGDAPAPGAGTPLRPSRRGLLGLIGAGAVGLAGGAAAGGAIVSAAAGGRGGAVGSAVPFYGEHQAGITTPAQDRLHFASFRMVSGTAREDLVTLLSDWTGAAAALTRGRALGTGVEPGNALLPPDDTGEAEGLGAARLTLTFGLGRSLFEARDGDPDPFGIADRLPAAFAPLPSFAFDLLEDAQSGGDLCVQACADDPQVAVHAIRNLARIATGRAHLAWSQLGFGRTASTSRAQETPRNLFGFKDGTANVMAEDAAALDAHVWVGDEGEAWMRGGSYLVARKIQMTIETWDRASLGEQQRVLGRTKAEGAPLSGGAEFDEPDFTAPDPADTSLPAIDAAAHVRLAHPTSNGGVRLLRRGYNYVDGSNGLGQLGAGLFFISFQNDPAAFVRVQRSLQPDLLNEYIRHIGSGLWAVPGGVREGEHLAQALFA
ncbi:iron uptake transporter deferrochelatase/peroxidase subunit [Leucobacter allii]|uniref:Deferrochelatase n=1 Tax=Leucobacter allii TaxID=2932247 RepID=A0ABY4FQV6_9MICO|nr:iron uptake transporter deferrochelatase/peroxidase subunit [Leucobacter allii]UOQ58657.1 iron uptake transporter deferrochelatase/peroxidase subunit [Leucobacter allii]